METNLAEISESVQMYLVSIIRIRKDDQPVPLSVLAEALSVSPVSVNEMCRKMQDQGLVIYRPYKGVLLTEEGQQFACRILRRHRLWEVFLVDKLGFSYEEAHEIACQLEHDTANSLADRLDAFLEYPSVNPLGEPIPRGEENLQVRPVVKLTAILAGQRVRVLRSDLDGAARDFLSENGIQRGAWLQVMASSDEAVLVKMGESVLSVMSELAQAIFVEADPSVELPENVVMAAQACQINMAQDVEEPIIKENKRMEQSANIIVQQQTLNNLKVGQRGIVVSVKSSGPIKRRMMDMGLVPGSEVRVLRVAPLGDPIEFEVKGYSLSLRKSEAKNIIVELAD
ncbi:MAG: FeoA domain-containing protein [Anaerolineaceae bacterium]|nr:FeoA domain-containing protein [Anaerolineaceae bacterium]